VGAVLRVGPHIAMLDEILNHVWMCVAYRDIYLLNFTEASCWESCCMLNGIHMPSHANACIHMSACVPLRRR
jgi:hypothetical protein